MAKIGINMATARLQEPEAIIGLELGTTHSAIAIVRKEDNTAILLRDIDGLALVPNATPLDAATLTPEVITELMALLRKRAEHILKTPVQKVVLTIPTQFGEAQKQLVRAAAAEIDLELVRLIDKPVAAAMAYGFGHVADDAEGDVQEKILVLEVENGTFNVNIVDRYNTILDVTGRAGLAYDIDNDIAQLLFKYWVENSGLNVEAADLQQTAENAIKYLNENDRFDGTFNGTPIFITKQSFNEVLEPVIAKMLGSLTELMERKKLSTANIDAVIMTGSAASIPYVKERVRNFFGNALYDSLNPEEVAALGTAVQANMLG